MRMGASSERYTTFLSIPGSENAPSPNHMYFIEINYITYLEYFDNLWLSLTCTLNMSNINLVINNLIIHRGTS